MLFDYSKLRGRIREIHSSEAAFAEKLGLTGGALSHKLNGHTDFSHKQIRDSIALLRISKDEIAEYFFTPLVKFSEHNDQQVG